MARLEDLHVGAAVEGLSAAGAVTIVQVEPHGSSAATVVYRDGAGTLGERILLRGDEHRLHLIDDARPWPLAGAVA